MMILNNKKLIDKINNLEKQLEFLKHENAQLSEKYNLLYQEKISLIELYDTIKEQNSVLREHNLKMEESNDELIEKIKELTKKNE